MKKKLTILLVLALMLTALSACGSSDSESDSSGGSSDFDPSQVKVMADVLSVDTLDYQMAYSETRFVYVFKVDEEYYRAYVDLPEDVAAEVNALDFSAEDRDEKLKELIGPLEITTFEHLNEQIPPQEELDKLVGKTGQELFADGWEYFYYNLEDMEAGMSHGIFSYTVMFDYDGEQMVNTDDFDFYEEFKDLKVKSVTFSGLGDAATLNEE